MSEPREPLHQPPNPDDLRRTPPTSPDCAKVRGLLRDFADRDLEAEAVLEVEEHVHRCRVCAVELARAEHEVLRLRSAMAAMVGNGPALDEGFAARVVDRLVLDETSLVSKEALARAAALARARGDQAAVGPEVARSEPARSWRSLAAIGVLSGLALLWALTLGLEVFGGMFRGPQREARLVVVQARDAFDGNRRLFVGDGMGDRHTVQVGPRGTATIEWHDPTTNAQPAATMSVRGGEVGLDQGGLRMHGEVDIDARRAVAITMADGSQVQLGEGRYSIQAEYGPEDGLLGEIPDLRVRVEVRSGELASIVRPGFNPTLVGSGQVGIYQGSTAVVVASSGSGGEVASTSSPRQDDEMPAAQPSAYLLGRALDSINVPVAGARVVVADGDSSTVIAAGADGGLQLLLRNGFQGNYVVASGAPPETRPELALLPPDVMRLVPQGRNRVMLDALRFADAMPFYAQVIDQQGVPCQGVRVLPLVVDDLFDIVLPLFPCVVVTDALGACRCNQLPARLPPHQSLRLLLLRDDLAPQVVTIPTRASMVASLAFPPIAMAPLRPVRLHLLHPNMPVEVLEDLPSLPPGTGFVRRVATADANGEVVALPVGRGAMWLRYSGGANAPLRSLTYDDPFSAVPRYRPGEEAFALATRFRPTLTIRDTAAEICSSFRHRQAFQHSGDASTAASLRFIDPVDPLAVSQVFVVDNSGPRGRINTRFAGFTAAGGAITLELGSGASVCALSSERGAVGAIGLGWSGGPTSMAPTGRVVVAANLRPAPGAAAVLPLRFLRQGSWPWPLQETTRFASAQTAWEVGDLLPGDYLVFLGTHQLDPITVPSSGFTVLH